MLPIIFFKKCLRFNYNAQAVFKVRLHSPVHKSERVSEFKRPHHLIPPCPRLPKQWKMIICSWPKDVEWLTYAITYLHFSYAIHAFVEKDLPKTRLLVSLCVCFGNHCKLVGHLYFLNSQEGGFMTQLSQTSRPIYYRSTSSSSKKQLIFSKKMLRFIDFSWWYVDTSQHFFFYALSLLCIF